MTKAQLPLHRLDPRARAAARRATRQKREGIVMLIVMMMLLMATGTAVFTIQSTQYEQRASSSVAEANWARGVAECTTMAALAYAENGAPPNLGTPWVGSGGQRAFRGRQFAIPDPTDANTSRSMDLGPSPYAANAPLTLDGFLPGERKRNSTYPMYQDRDQQTVNTPGLRYTRAHWLQETFTINPPVQVDGTTPPPRLHIIVTGFAEVHVWGDNWDSSGVRELHELDAASRGFIDR